METQAVMKRLFPTKESIYFRLTPVILFMITAFSYGLFSLQQGFHWDDWAFAWIPHTYGPAGWFQYYTYDRPFMAYLLSLTTSLIGPDPFAWQIFGIFWRWVSGLSLWWLLSSVWPEKKHFNFWTTVLFLVYPGYLQQTIAIVYGQFYILETLFFVSVAFTVVAVKGSRFRNWLIFFAVLTSAINIFFAEYFIGFEILRPVFIWLALSGEADYKNRIKKTLFFMLPFIFVYGLNIYWRMFIFTPKRYGLALLDQINASPEIAISALPKIMFSQWITVIQAWLQVLKFPAFSDFGIRLTLVYAVILIASLVGLIRFSSLINLPDGPKNLSKFLGIWLLVGIISLVGASIPFLVSGLPVRLDYPYDRFTLPFALGVAMIVVGVLELLLDATSRVYVLSLLTILAIGFQIQVGFAFRSEWNLVKNYFWQMAWRIPAMEPGTVILSTHLPFQFSTDNSLTYPINWMYAPENRSDHISIANLDIDARLGTVLPGLEPGKEIQIDYRVATFESDTDHAIVLHYSSPGCLRILDPRYDSDLWVAPKSPLSSSKLLNIETLLLPYWTGQALPLSNLSQITPSPGAKVQMPEFFGPEPEHRWCYYFQQADLSRQQGDWKNVAKIGDEIFSIPFYPDDPAEYLPFIEAYARMGRWEEARDLTRKTADVMTILRPSLCAIWQRVKTDSASPIPATQIEKMKEEVGYCPYP